MSDSHTWNVDIEGGIPTAVIVEPSDGAIVENPVSFMGYGEPTENFKSLLWYDGSNPIHEDDNASGSSFEYTLSPGVHNIGFIVFSETNGWSEYTWITITVIAGGVIATIVSGEWYTGPYTPGEVVTLAKVTVRNDGNIAGGISYCDFFYPGQPNEIRGTTVGYSPLQPSETKDFYPMATIPPDAQPGALPAGVKVWGDTEEEPSWTLGGGTVGEPLPPFILPAIAIVGLIGVAYWASKNR